MADFREYYGVGLRACMEMDPVEAAALATQLRAGSRTMAAIDGRLAFSMADRVAATATDAVLGLAWALGGGRGDRPKPTLPPIDTNTDGDAVAIDVDDYLAALADARAAFKSDDSDAGEVGR